MLQFSLFQSFTNLAHGVFPANYGNTSWHYGNQKTVTTNINTISRKLNINPAKIIITNQTHSSRIRVIKSKLNQNKLLPSTDGLLTNQPNIYLLIKTADCIPLFLFDPATCAVGLVHVGWQGANQGIHLQAIKLLVSNFNSTPEGIIVGIGPGICTQCYTHSEVPEQVQEPKWQKFISHQGPTWHVDLKGFIKFELLAFGIKPEHIEDMNLCTYEDQRFFSHRRSITTHEPEGRFANIIGTKL